MKVYFKLSQAKLAASSIVDLTPNKLYEATPIDSSDSIGLIKLVDDAGFKLTVRTDGPSAHLDYLTRWIKHRARRV